MIQALVEIAIVGLVLGAILLWCCCAVAGLADERAERIAEQARRHQDGRRSA